MSAVLKSGSAALRQKVRPLTLARSAPEPSSADRELERLRAALAEAEAALAARDEALAAIPAQVEEAFGEGEAKGRRDAADMEAERLDALRDAAERALARFSGDMAALERLAALLARTCLDRMLLASEERARILADLVRAQVARLEAGAALRIQVSAEDFAAPDTLDGLAAPPCEIVASPTLAPGDCVIQLRLGALEVGIDQQWGTLREALEEMAG